MDAFAHGVETYIAPCGASDVPEHHRDAENTILVFLCSGVSYNGWEQMTGVFAEAHSLDCGPLVRQPFWNVVSSRIRMREGRRLAEESSRMQAAPGIARAIVECAIAV